MGHIRLGRLPKTYRWLKLLAILDESPADAAGIAAAASFAAERRLKQLANDPSVGYCFWLLARLASAARSTDFIGSLAALGLAADPNIPTIGFIAQLSGRVGLEIGPALELGPFPKMAALSLQKTLTESIGQQPQGLFGSSVDDLRLALRGIATEQRFGSLGRRFFADFLGRTLKFFLDKELANHTGPGNKIASISESRELLTAIDTHAYQSARIVEDFTGEWWSKHDWETGGAISREEAEGFAAYALEKLRTELEQERQR